MKTIKWIAGIGLATASLTAILLSTASAGDVVYKVKNKHTLTPAEAAVYFADIAGDKCPLAVGKTHQLVVKRIEVKSDSSTDTMYGWVCVSKDSGTLDEMLDAMELATRRHLVFRDLGVIGSTDHWSLTGAGVITPAQAAGYLGAFAAQRCSAPANRVVKIIATKQGAGYHAECSGVTTDTQKATGALRADASTDEMLDVEILGRVVE